MNGRYAGFIGRHTAGCWSSIDARSQIDTELPSLHCCRRELRSYGSLFRPVFPNRSARSYDGLSVADHCSTTLNLKAIRHRRSPCAAPSSVCARCPSGRLLSAKAPPLLGRLAPTPDNVVHQRPVPRVLSGLRNCVGTDFVSLPQESGSPMREHSAPEQPEQVLQGVVTGFLTGRHQDAASIRQCSGAGRATVTCPRTTLARKQRRRARAA